MLGRSNGTRNGSWTAANHHTWIKHAANRITIVLGVFEHEAAGIRSARHSGSVKEHFPPFGKEIFPAVAISTCRDLEDPENSTRSTLETRLF